MEKRIERREMTSSGLNKRNVWNRTQITKITTAKVNSNFSSMNVEDEPC